MKRLLLSLSIMFCLSVGINAQITTPPSGNNQKSIVTQYIGSIVHVTIKYNSPMVRGRKGEIWGKLVPWGMSPNNFGTAAEIPWRAGANENTIIKFSHDVKVNGFDIPAGAYGYHVIPSEFDDWTIIFSKTTDAWGSYFYEESMDQLRVKSTPQQSEFHEYLSFEFVDKKPESTRLALKWENISLPITISVPNIKELYVEKMEGELKNDKGFMWQNWATAATYCATNDIALDKALAWADNAISGVFVGQENFTTLSTKALVLGKLDRNSEAEEIMMKAIKHDTANPGQVHNYGRSLIISGQTQKALEVMQFNYDKNEGDWPTSVGLMRAYSALGEYEKAVKFAKMAVEQAPDAPNRDFLEKAVERLKNKENIN